MIAPQTDVYTDFSGLAGLRARAQNDSSPETLREVARQFEALFTRMMLKSMRDASFGGGILDGPQAEFYQDMFDGQLSMELAKGRGLGFADLLVQQLGGSGPVVPDAVPHPEPAPVSPGEFVTNVLPLAKRAASELGVSTRAVIAQAALETGWGQYLMRRGDGTPANNLFGIKAGASWSGPSVSRNTVEFVDGIAVKRREAFRAYATPEEGFDDYVDLLKTNPRYKEVLTKGQTLDGFADAIAGAGYATDPAYARKLRAVFQNEAISKLKDSNFETIL